MSSLIANRTLTTCRGRLEHLRAHLPTWLERMPNWEPLVVCCDDPEAFEFCAQTFRNSDRGQVLLLEQPGGFFNKIEALRAGLDFLEAAIGRNEVIAEKFVRSRLPEHKATPWHTRVALWDADTAAIRVTENALAKVPHNEIAISSSPCTDDVGFLLAPLWRLLGAFRLLEPGAFEGYGPEDFAIRVALWVAYRSPFHRIPACWARLHHPDFLRRKFQRTELHESTQANQAALADLIARHIARKHLPAMCEAIGWLPREDRRNAS